MRLDQSANVDWLQFFFGARRSVRCRKSVRASIQVADDSLHRI